MSLNLSAHLVPSPHPTTHSPWKLVSQLHLDRPLVMTGSALSEAAKKQKGRRQVNKRTKEAIETYCSEKNLHGTASYLKIAGKFDINRVIFSNLEQEKNCSLSEFNA